MSRMQQGVRDGLIGAGIGIIFTALVILCVMSAPYDREQAHNLPDYSALGSHIK